ncbi:hypothetical protein VMCG_05799 [Cytospora schulzeri]|uniref:Uncharacterized protein n=1 Tax=Cytospora schulzeri TaxID=448051 RepID=A0A423WI67_9PEZI|nr:hypothetical protein VMCG_05799 [Valsa malicola]
MTDLIYLDGHVDSCIALCLALVEDGSNGNEIAHLAIQEPDAGLLVSASMGRKFDPEHMRKLSQILETVTDDEEVALVLYERFLRLRDHCLLELWCIDIPLAGAARDEAIRTGLMSQQGEETPPAIVHPDDTATSPEVWFSGSWVFSNGASTLLYPASQKAFVFFSAADEQKRISEVLQR